jgi:hypothetical protein
MDPQSFDSIDASAGAICLYLLQLDGRDHERAH